SGLTSFADGLYSTLWGDGLCGGAGLLASRTPWNYQWMALGFPLAIVPSALITIGAVSALSRLLRQFDPVWVVLLGFGGALTLATVHWNLVVPSYAEAKSIFGLAAILPLCACAAQGWAAVIRLPRSLQIAAAIGLSVWALDAYASFWIRGNSAATQAVLG